MNIKIMEFDKHAESECSNIYLFQCQSVFPWKPVVGNHRYWIHKKGRRQFKELKRGNEVWFFNGVVSCPPSMLMLSKTGYFHLILESTTSSSSNDKPVKAEVDDRWTCSVLSSIPSFLLRSKMLTCSSKKQKDKRDGML